MLCLPVLSAGRDLLAIQYPQHITKLLARMKSCGTQRVHIGAHSMSIGVGTGSNGTVSTAYFPVYATGSMFPTLSTALNTARGGAFAPGLEMISSTDSTGGGLNGFFTIGGGVAVIAKWNGAAGTCGQGVSLQATQAHTIAFTVTGGRAGQVVRIYAYATAAAVTARYAMSGANTQATTALPVSTTASPCPAQATYYWYETNLTLTNAGTTTVTLSAQVAAGGSMVVYAVDPDLRVDAGLTLHRLSQAGQTLGTIVGESIDNTDVAPTGLWLTGTPTAAGWRQSNTDSLTLRPGIQGVLAGCDINDILAYANNAGAYNFGWKLSDHNRHLNNYVAAMASRSLEVLFVLGPLRAPDTPAVISGAGTPYTQTDVINIYKTVAAASPNVAVLDMTQVFRGSNETTTFAAQTADTSRWNASEAPRYVHPNASGHAYYGAVMSTAIQNAW